MNKGLRKLEPRGTLIFFPRLRQSATIPALSKQVGRATIQDDGTCALYAHLVAAAAGAAGAIEVIDIPQLLAPRVMGVPGTGGEVDPGHMTVYDSGTAYYHGVAHFGTQFSVGGGLNIVGETDTTGSFVGSSPAITLAAGDTVIVRMVYELAGRT